MYGVDSDKVGKNVVYCIECIVSHNSELRYLVDCHLHQTCAFCKGMFYLKVIQ